MSKTNIKIEVDLIEKVKAIAENKFPLRNITSYAEATREALIEFVKKNQRYSKPLNNQIAKATEGSS